MSTRSTISVEDEHDKFTIYRHCDGYPDGPHGVPSELRKVLTHTWELPRFEADDFAAAIVRAWKDGGGNIRLTTGHDRHADTEFQYFVSCKDGVIHLRVDKVGFVFGRVSSNERDRDTICNGPLDEVVAHFDKETG